MRKAECANGVLPPMCPLRALGFPHAEHEGYFIRSSSPRVPRSARMPAVGRTTDKFASALPSAIWFTINRLSRLEGAGEGYRDHTGGKRGEHRRS